jgi:hypothetical protein
MDDWWIATANDEEGRKLHKQMVHEFFDKMEECSYFLKPKKCVKPAAGLRARLTV